MSSGEDSIGENRGERRFESGTGSDFEGGKELSGRLLGRVRGLFGASGGPILKGPLPEIWVPCWTGFSRHPQSYVPYLRGLFVNYAQFSKKINEGNYSLRSDAFLSPMHEFSNKIGGNYINHNIQICICRYNNKFKSFTPTA